MSLRVDFVPLPLAAMDALLASDLEAASELAGVELTPYILEHGWLWEIRAEQVRRDPAAAAWVARAAVVDGVVVEVGEQWDEEDGLELIFERPVRR